MLLLHFPRIVGHVGPNLLLIDNVGHAIAENLTPLLSLFKDAIILLFPSFRVANQW